MGKLKNYKNISIFTVCVMLSRILGYFRDMFFAYFFGSGFLTDVFYAAYKVPNLFRRLLGEGALISAFVPVYTDYKMYKTEKEQKDFLDSTFSVLFLLLFLLTILGIIFTPQIIKIISPGFASNPEKFKLTILLSRIMFPFFISVGIGAFFMGILHVYQIFMYSALSSCFLNISEIFSMLIFCNLFSNEKSIYFLAIFVVIGGFMQAFFQIIPIIKNKIKFKLKSKIDLKNDGLKKIITLIIPTTFSSSVEQISSFIDIVFASYLEEGSITFLHYSNHLMLLPLSLFGIAVSNVSLSSLSKYANQKDLTLFKKNLYENINIMLYFITPSTIGLFLLSDSIVKLLFERGKFNSYSTFMTASTLRYYIIGLFSYAAVKIIVSSFNAIKKPKIPLITAIIAVFINILLNFLFMKILFVKGIALATSISSIFNLILLIYFFNKNIENVNYFRENYKYILKIFFSSILMGIICFLVKTLLIKNLFFSVFLSIIFSIISYLFITYLLKVNEILFINKLIRNKLNFF